MQLYNPKPAEDELPKGPAPRCQFLEWDSQFFQYRIGSVQEQRLSSDGILEIESWCKSQQIDCLYFLAEFQDPETIRLAEKNFFHLVDVRITMVLPVSGLTGGAPAEGSIRLSQEHDIPVLRRIARSCHTDSRFYFDPNFWRSRCDALYETWIESSCRGFADVVFVSEVNGEPAGYISCHLRPDNTGNIGLVGLAPEARGKKLGMALVKTALHWFGERNVKRVTVVTQGRNIAAQKLYQRCGFVTESLRLWYHRWFIAGHTQANESL